MKALTHKKCHYHCPQGCKHSSTRQGFELDEMLSMFSPFPSHILSFNGLCGILPSFFCVVFVVVDGGAVGAVGIG